MAYLRVVLDKTSYAVGEPIRGLVEVENDKDCKCTALHVWAKWHTHGRGNTARGEAEKLELFQGMWTAGDHPSYPFQLPPLLGPLTYHGTELNVDWEVHATADVPWAIDPKGDAPLTLTRGSAPPERVNQLTVPVMGQQAAMDKALVPVAGCLLLFFFRQVSLLRRQVENASRIATQAVSNYKEGLEQPALQFERQLQEFARTNPDFQVRIARFFAPAGSPTTAGAATNPPPEAQPPTVPAATPPQ